MKIRLYSDLHVEFELHRPLRSNGEEVLVIAGDLGTWSKPEQCYAFLKEASELFPHVIYIAGNHEYYGYEYTDGIPFETPENVHYLYNESIEINGVKFLGTTLWTDLGIPDEEKVEIVRGLNDFNDIEYVGNSFSLLDWEHEHKKAREFLERELEEGSDKIQVVVSHHAPLRESLDEYYVPVEYQAAYCSDLSNVFKTKQPDYWLHGHIHVAKDYTYEKTRVISNPKGYPGQETGYWHGLTIELKED